MKPIGSAVARTGALVVGALVIIALLAPAAGAVLVRLSGGRLAGVTPVQGVSPAALPGALVRQSPINTSSNGNLDYHNGPVLHGATPYLVFWDPGNQISPIDKALYERYLADSAADRGRDSNIWAVDRQYTDSTGFADYSQSWTHSQAITDTRSYPASGCSENAGFTETACLTDSQIQAEVGHLITANGLPSGLSGASGLSGQAPIYLVITPPTVNSCYTAQGQLQCADSRFCAYHSVFTTGSTTVLYANLPMLLDTNRPKECQDDENGPVQAPNGRPTADVLLKALSHEMSETITDPLGTAWWDSNSGNEVADNCNFAGALDPGTGYNPNAFTPTLGGTSSAGNLYNQLIAGDPYYTQSMWSNGDVNCEQRPVSSALSAAFSAPLAAVPGSTITLDPSASASASGFSSATWDFGDGSTSFGRGGPATATHSYTTSGTYTATLTVVDNRGNESVTSRRITVGDMVAAFTIGPPHPLVGQTVTYDGTPSVDDMGMINSYSWVSAGQAQSGPTASYTYPTAGPHPVTLAITDDHGNTVQSTQTITVDNPPVAAFSVPTAHPVAGAAVSFDGTGSDEPLGSIVGYSWSFGDGSAPGSDPMPSHAYAAPGNYNVTLTVTDADGHTAMISHQVTVFGLPQAAFGVTTAAPRAGSPVSFTSAGSGEPGGSLASYNWSFGDGAAAGGTGVSHTYATPGIYTVTLTVADPEGHTAAVSHAVDVGAPPRLVVPTSVISVITTHPVAGLPVRLSAARSTVAGSRLTGYRWSFGDRHTATRRAPAHRYAKPGRYRITLMVTAATGTTKSVTRTLRVGSAGIVGVSARAVRTQVRVRLTFSGPGTLTAGTRKMRIPRPEAFVYRITITRGEQVRLRSHHHLTLRLRVRFIPKVGAASRRTLVLHLKH